MTHTFRTRVVLAATLTAFSAPVAAASAQAPPPPPTAASGQAVTAIASGLPTPTAFAFDGSTVFAASGPAEKGSAQGGVFLIANGTATRLPNSPPFAFGLVWHKDTLYISAGQSILAWSGWNGSTFASMKTIYSGGKKFVGFNGLAFGPDGRLYAGLSLDEKYDHKKDPARLSQGVVSMKAGGKDLKLVAKGLRQPFQLTFPKGSHHPYVTDLSQDKGKIPPDHVDIVRSGQDYGFPTCTWLNKAACRGFAKPFATFPKHASPMGIGSIGDRLYVSLFGGTGKGPEVVSMPVKGGKATPFLTGFAAPVIALGTHAGNVYVGDLTGTLYAVTP